MNCWLRRIALAVAALVAVFAAALAIVDTDVGHRWVAERIGAIRTANGLRFTVGRIDGSLYGQARLKDVRVQDLDGLLVQAPVVTLDWKPWLWFRNRLDIAALAIPQATLFHAPHTRKSAKRGPILPDFDIRIGRLAIDRLVLAKPVLGTERIGRVVGRADIRRGRALVRLDADVAGSDRLALRIDAEPDRDRFDVDVRASGAAGGVLARGIGIRRALTLDIGGDGSWSRWRGRAVGRAGTVRAVDLALAADAGRYTLSGNVAPGGMFGALAERLARPRMLVNGSATFAERRLDGALSLRSPAIATEVTGLIDLGASAFRNVRVRTRLLRPAAVIATMSGRGVELRAVLDGGFDAARFDFRLRADRLGVDRTGMRAVRLAGSGRLGQRATTMPVRFAAAEVTGVGNVAGGILRNLSLDGPLVLKGSLLTGDALRLRSDKLAGRIMLAVDFATGRYEMGLNGTLNRLYIKGLGVVDLRSDLRVVPGAGGRGTRIVGRGAVQVIRLDNGFLRGLTGGLPRIVTGLERTPDGVLHFTDMVLTSPLLTLRGNGLRRRDETFHIEAVGRHGQYGPVTMRLDGKIDRPTLDLIFARPNDTLGLSQVRAHLDPTAQGFDWRAEGGSRLGPFAATGSILLLPPGVDDIIQVDRLAVSGTVASGRLAIVSGGFTGTLNVAGGGLSGELLLRPVGTVQRIEMHLAAANARLSTALLRRGRLDATMLLDPAGTSIDATATGLGLRQGRLSLARFAGNARLRGGVGEVRASIAGSRGRAFDIQTVTQVSPDRYVVAAEGTLDRRSLKLLTPAEIVRDGDGWRLSSTRLAFAGGEGAVSGRFGAGGLAVDASLTRMPLAILDIGFPRLGLSGTASGTFSYDAVDGQAPTGKANVTVRGLSRAGLVLSSRPIDVGLAAALSVDRLGVRAVMASGGKTIGRGQALLRPLGTGDLASRIAAAPLFAQLRYQGPADTLWRLTGVELFDLSGPVAIGADVSGRIDAPVIRGVLQASGARIESANTGTVLTNVAATGRFGGSRLQIDRFAADAGKGGRVTGSGGFDFAANGGIGIDIRLAADHAVMINRDDIGATVTGPLTFTSDGTGGRIAGDVVLNRSRYRLGQATAATAVPRLNIREINLPDGGEEDEAPIAPWTLAIKAKAADKVIVSGLGLSSEWSADLAIAGEPANPAITGAATLVRGDYEFAGRKFELNRGIIRFAGEVPANPALDIEANADSTGLSAAIRVTGTALKPEIGFSSVPALPQDELLSRLLFGTSITSLSAPEALQLASAVAALQNGGNGLNPINAVRRAAGLDRLRILPADPQTGQGTSIAAGKYVTRRLYAEIVTDGQGYSATQVEFQVTRWLSLLSSISTLGRQSANVRVSKDY
ncbi:translocation and assembly module TamB [Sphingomonas insulae]|uniref:Translocation/assembly module TamB domain-containing protein n=1 Tax=Sphingomonas insulae TaxID=424800 RepID=A0ABP3T1M2_9SPHN|nr:translocation/assembly module TamB domain-containing protein [Sphingomonas insulae]NIJ29601.1 translocation and assembly module TamB [Sphingomonas insulae]